MKVLFLAPHPFYQARGTPIAVDLLVGALAGKGIDVDVLTYHEGEDRTYDGPGRVCIHRIKPPPGCRGVRPGFSLKKIVADIWMHRNAMRLAATRTYDVIHAVEESAFMAMRIASRFGIPYVFDMDSSMPEQIADKLPLARPLLPLMRRFERAAVRKATAVAAVCDALGDIALDHGARKLVLLRDVPLLDATRPADARGFRDELGITGIVLLYIGNLEKYQGIDLLLQSFALLSPENNASLVIVGGIPAHIERYRALAKELGIDSRVHFTGPRPISDMKALMNEADILVSPRTQGTNTPMKIYSYMAAGKAILATDLFTHTQVLDNAIARLAPPDPAAFAKVADQLIGDAGLRAQLGAAAVRAVDERYSLAVFQRTVGELYDWLAAAKE